MSLLVCVPASPAARHARYVTPSGPAAVFGAHRRMRKMSLDVGSGAVWRRCIPNRVKNAEHSRSSCGRCANTADQCSMRRRRVAWGPVLDRVSGGLACEAGVPRRFAKRPRRVRGRRAASQRNAVVLVMSWRRSSASFQLASSSSCRCRASRGGRRRSEAVLLAWRRLAGRGGPCCTGPGVGALLESPRRPW